MRIRVTLSSSSTIQKWRYGNDLLTRQMVSNGGACLDPFFVDHTSACTWQPIYSPEYLATPVDAAWCEEIGGRRDKFDNNVFHFGELRVVTTAISYAFVKHEKVQFDGHPTRGDIFSLLALFGERT